MVASCGVTLVVFFNEHNYRTAALLSSRTSGFFIYGYHSLSRLQRHVPEYLHTDDENNDSRNK